jgi:hypothetical protein
MIICANPMSQLRAGSIADALEAIVDLDFTDLADIEPPRGYGRD